MVTQGNSEITALKKIFEETSLRCLKYDSYFEVYEKVLKPYINQPITLLEIGVQNGGSLQMWRKYLGSSARIIGVDLNPEVKKNEANGFEICIGDQADPKFWKSFLEKYGALDIVIDDGGHTNHQQLTSLVSLLPNLRQGGLYLIEDLHCSYMPSFGNPSRWSTINFLISGIHSINTRSPLLQQRINLFTNNVFSITFFESIAVINVLEQQSTRAKRVKNTGLRTIPNDFRMERFRKYFLSLGYEAELKRDKLSNLKNFVRIFLQFIILKIQNKSAKNIFKEYGN
jgi:hypothetical protein